MWCTVYRDVTAIKASQGSYRNFMVNKNLFREKVKVLYHLDDGSDVGA